MLGSIKRTLFRRVRRPEEFATDAERLAYVEDLRAQAQFASTSTWPAIATALAVVVLVFSVKDLGSEAVLGTVALGVLALAVWIVATRRTRLTELALAELELKAFLEGTTDPDVPLGVQLKREKPRGDAHQVWALLPAACGVMLATAVPSTLSTLIFLLSIIWSVGLGAASDRPATPSASPAPSESPEGTHGV